MNNDIFFELPNLPLFAEIKGFLAANRQIPVCGQINEKLVTQVAGMLLQFDYRSTDPITLLLHTNGGDFRYSYHLCDIINALNSPVHGLVVGEAASVGVDILQMCKRRLMLPHATLFLHFIRTGNFRVIARSDFFADADAKAIRRHVLGGKRSREKLYMKRTGKPLKEVQKFLRYGEDYDITLSAEEALKEKFIDAIVTDFKFFPGFKGRDAV